MLAAHCLQLSQLIKQADDGTRLGAYFASKPAERSYHLNSPHTALGTTLMANPVADVVGLREMLLARMAGRTSKERGEKLDDNVSRLEQDGYLRSGHRYGKRWAKPGAVWGAILGGLIGASLDQDKLFRPRGQARAINTLAGAGAGAIGGAVGGYLGGAPTGVLDKFIIRHTSAGSKARARKFKSEHPYATALPFGDVVGAALSEPAR